MFVLYINNLYTLWVYYLFHTLPSFYLSYLFDFSLTNYSWLMIKIQLIFVWSNYPAIALLASMTHIALFFTKEIERWKWWLQWGNYNLMWTFFLFTTPANYHNAFFFRIPFISIYFHSFPFSFPFISFCSVSFSQPFQIIYQCEMFHARCISV